MRHNYGKKSQKAAVHVGVEKRQRTEKHSYRYFATSFYNEPDGTWISLK